MPSAVMIILINPSYPQMVILKKTRRKLYYTREHMQANWKVNSDFTMYSHKDYIPPNTAVHFSAGNRRYSEGSGLIIMIAIEK